MKAKAKSSLEYWREREEVQRQKNIKDEVEYEKSINSIHQQMYENIKKEINDFYVKYANSEGITLHEAKKRVSGIDVHEFSQKATEYVKNRDFSERANQELKLYNTTMKINRLELLKAKIGLEMCGSYSELEKLFGDKLDDRVLEELERQAGILGKTVKGSEKLADSIVNASFHNATYSDRIWMHHDLLRNELDDVLRRGLIQGLNPKSLTGKVMPLIMEAVKNKGSSARTLLRTEMARVQIDAQMKSYERNEYDRYIFLAEPTACPHCRRLDDKVFDVKDAMPGENAPPLHPNCRCSTAAYVANDNELS